MSEGIWQIDEEPFMINWVVYDHPRDFPDKFVVRRFDLFRGQAPRPSRICFTADSLEAIREFIPPGLFCLPRYGNDDPNIVEVWL